VLLAANRVPAKTLPELIAWAKGNPGSIAARQQRHLAPSLVQALRRRGGRERHARALKPMWTTHGAEPGGSSQEAFRALIEKEVAK
jgi:hypothetical protein